MDYFYTNINPMDWDNWEYDMELQEANAKALEVEKHKKIKEAV